MFSRNCQSKQIARMCAISKLETEWTKSITLNVSTNTLGAKWRKHSGIETFKCERFRRAERQTNNTQPTISDNMLSAYGFISFFLDSIFENEYFVGRANMSLYLHSVWPKQINRNRPREMWSEREKEMEHDRLKIEGRMYWKAEQMNRLSKQLFYYFFPILRPFMFLLKNIFVFTLSRNNNNHSRLKWSTLVVIAVFSFRNASAEMVRDKKSRKRWSIDLLSFGFCLFSCVSPVFFLKCTSLHSKWWTIITSPLLSPALSVPRMEFMKVNPRDGNIKIDVCV